MTFKIIFTLQCIGVTAIDVTCYPRYHQLVLTAALWTRKSADHLHGPVVEGKQTHLMLSPLYYLRVQVAGSHTARGSTISSGVGSPYPDCSPEPQSQEDDQGVLAPLSHFLEGTRRREMNQLHLRRRGWKMYTEQTSQAIRGADKPGERTKQTADPPPYPVLKESGGGARESGPTMSDRAKFVSGKKSKAEQTPARIPPHVG